MIKVINFDQRFYVKDPIKIKYWESLEKIEKSRAFLVERKTNIVIKQIEGRSMTKGRCKNCGETRMYFHYEDGRCHSLPGSYFADEGNEEKTLSGSDHVKNKSASEPSNFEEGIRLHDFNDITGEDKEYIVQLWNKTSLDKQKVLDVLNACEYSTVGRMIKEELGLDKEANP